MLMFLLVMEVFGIVRDLLQKSGVNFHRYILLIISNWHTKYNKIIHTIQNAKECQLYIYNLTKSNK